MLEAWFKLGPGLLFYTIPNAIGEEVAEQVGSVKRAAPRVRFYVGLAVMGGVGYVGYKVGRALTK